MPPGTGVSGMESDSADRFYCDGGPTGKVRAVRRPHRSRGAPPSNLSRSYAKLNGISRNRCPVSFAIAFANAGASGGTPGSPMPLGGSLLGTM